MKPERTTAETQLLVALAMLEGAGRATDAAALAAYGLDHFGMYLADWSGAHETLMTAGLVERREDGYHLTPAGKVVADRLRSEHARHLYFYNEYFTRALTSAAHALFCERVYGRDLCQHGMMDMEQLGKLIEVLQLGPESRVLELGCGNGRVAEYISDTTGAHVVGVDTSRVGIAQALERTRQKRDRLDFMQGDMALVSFPPQSFDTIIAVDAIQYVRDMDALLLRLGEMLQPGGQLGIFISSWAAPDEPKDKLRPDGNRFAQSVARLDWASRYWDFSPQEIAHWTHKLQVAAEMRAQFEAEGNAFLYHRRWIEAEYHRAYVEPGNVSRYLYHIRL